MLPQPRKTASHTDKSPDKIRGGKAGGPGVSLFGAYRLLYDVEKRAEGS